jgi:hypothetical protein
MRQLATGYKGIGLLVDVNSDRLLSILIIVAAMAAVGLVGVEYASSSIVQGPQVQVTASAFL